MMARDDMREARDALIAQQRQQRHDRVSARLNEEAAVNRAAKDPQGSDNEVAQFIKDLNNMKPKDIKKGVRRMKSGMSWGQKRAVKKALKGGK